MKYVLIESTNDEQNFVSKLQELLDTSEFNELLPRLAKRVNIEPDDLIKNLKILFSSLLKNKSGNNQTTRIFGADAVVGKHNDISDDKFDRKQLAMGIIVELEHTDDYNIAKSIAKDHLGEGNFENNTTYYTNLLKYIDKGDKKKVLDSIKKHGYKIDW